MLAANEREKSKKGPLTLAPDLKNYTKLTVRLPPRWTELVVLIM
jgi:hypothetical protein